MTTKCDLCDHKFTEFCNGCAYTDEDGLPILSNNHNEDDE